MWQNLMTPLCDSARRPKRLTNGACFIRAGMKNTGSDAPISDLETHALVAAGAAPHGAEDFGARSTGRLDRLV